MIFLPCLVNPIKYSILWKAFPPIPSNLEAQGCCLIYGKVKINGKDKFSFSKSYQLITLLKGDEREVGQQSRR